MASPAAQTMNAPNWQLGFAIAGAAHLALGVAIALQHSAIPPRIPDPVMIVELPAGIAAPSPALSTPQDPVQPQQEVQTPLPQMVAPRIEVPDVAAPLPPDPVVIPTPRPITRPISRAVPPPRNVAPPRPAPPPPVAPTGTGASGSGTGDDPRAKEARNDWYSLIFADLARKKRYPREAKRAGQEGTPTVRFTVDQRGRVSNISITRSSGHQQLDDATVELIRRAAPLPPMPRAMGRDSVTMSLPIEYELDRD